MLAKLLRTSNAIWDGHGYIPKLGEALGPGRFLLKSGFAQIAFNNGARIVLAGPGELEIVSSKEVFCHSGQLTADVPPSAHGFRVSTPRVDVVDMGTEFGLTASSTDTEVEVFKGTVECSRQTAEKVVLKADEAVSVDDSGSYHHLPSDHAKFAGLFTLEQQARIAEAQRLGQWHKASLRLDANPSALVHFDFEGPPSVPTVLHNLGSSSVADGAILGGQWTQGRWQGKRALEFGGSSDSVRVHVPGGFDALTFAVWVNVESLDREFNSLFMCDGFDDGKIHWQIRNNGVLDLGVQGLHRHDVEIFASPPIVDSTKFGQWLHLAVVLDGKSGQITMFANGAVVTRQVLHRPPPYRIGDAELGNWNSGDIPDKPPSLIRYFSGAMDEFMIFDRALRDGEIRQLYEDGQPGATP
jgi:hypothetical protein